MVSKTARNEQIKLSATFINNIGTAMVVAGMVVLAFGQITERLYVVIAILGLIFGTGLHLIARFFFLNHLKD